MASIMGATALAVAIVAPAPAAPVAAPAAAPASIACVAAETPDAERQAILRSAADMVAGSSKAPLPEAQKKAIAAAAGICARRNNWTAQQASAAGAYTLARLARGPIDAAIRRTGNDPARWVQVVRALPYETGVDLATGDDAAVGAFTSGLEAAGVKPDVGTLRLAGVLAAIVLMEDGALVRFAER